MQDYPEDCATISEVFHAEKMLLDIPPEIVTPTIRVHGKIFFVNELLQRSSGAYFIPERFFFRATSSSSGQTGGSEKEFFALGFDVDRYDVGY
jgi:hypothetical protein